MKLAALLAALLLWQTTPSPAWQTAEGPTATPAPQFFRYQRSIVPEAAGPNCTVLDAATFAHAAASLKDLRLYPQTPAPHEIPYAITLSEP